MSHQAEAWFLSEGVRGLTAAEAHVGTVLAIRHHDGVGGAFPGLERLAAECGRSVRSVQRLLRQLVAKGVLRIAPGRLPGGWVGTLYCFVALQRPAGGPPRSQEAGTKVDSEMPTVVPKVVPKMVEPRHKNGQPASTKMDSHQEIERESLTVIEQKEPPSRPPSVGRTTSNPTPAPPGGREREGRFSRFFAGAPPRGSRGTGASRGRSSPSDGMAALGRAVGLTPGYEPPAVRAFKERLRRAQAQPAWAPSVGAPGGPAGVP